MKKTIGRILLVLASVALALALALEARAQSAPPVATFDTVWSVINRMHFDSTFGGVDWQKVRTEFRPQAEAARTRAELRPILTRMIERLKQSHFSIIPQEALDDRESASGQGDVGFDVRYIEKAITVTRVDADGPAARAGIKPGWRLTRVGDQSIARILERAKNSRSQQYSYELRAALVARAALGGAEDSTVRLGFRNERNREVTVQVKRRTDPGVAIRFGDLPTMFSRFESRTVQSAGRPVGVVWFNVWMIPVMAPLDSAIDRMRGSAGLVVDLRGNPGGVGAMSMGVAGHVVDTARTFGVMHTRTGPLTYKVNPRRSNPSGDRVAPFAGPVAVLMDELSGSTSEVFAGGLQSIRRVRVFGVKSMGAVLPARTMKLPNGDVLYHAIADFVTADGTLLEGRGVIPDEQVMVKRADLLAGKDPVLEAALRWIAAEASARKTHPQGNHLEIKQ